MHYLVLTLCLIFIFSSTAEAFRRRKLDPSSTDDDDDAGAKVLSAAKAGEDNFGVVTLVTGNKGYNAGAVALGQSLKDVGSKLKMVCMVSVDVPAQDRKSIAAVGWEVLEVPSIACNYKHHLSGDKYDLEAEHVKVRLR